jgi:ligand-binding SRPBCC domain-containing protein
MLRDEVDYAIPLGTVGRWLGGWFVRRKLEAMFGYRHETTRRLIESGEWTVTTPASDAASAQAV